MQEAASREGIKVIENLLADGVHADIRIKSEDKTAFDAAADPEVRQLLYKNGAKVHSSDGSIPWTYWHGIDSKSPDLSSKFEESLAKSGQICSIRDKEFRALIADIYTRPPASDDQQNSNNNVSEKSGDNRGIHEIHRITHPTVEELIDGKGPHAIMGKIPEDFSAEKGYKHLRWIHLPMNHVS